MARITICVSAVAYFCLLAVVRPVDLETQEANGLTEPRGHLDEQLRAKRSTEITPAMSGPVTPGDEVSGGGVSENWTPGLESGEMDEGDYFYKEDGYQANYDYYQYDNNETDWYYQYDNNETDWNGTEYDYKDEYYQFDYNGTDWNGTMYDYKDEAYVEEYTGNGNVL